MECTTKWHTYKAVRHMRFEDVGDGWLQTCLNVEEVPAASCNSVLQLRYLSASLPRLKPPNQLPHNNNNNNNNNNRNNKNGLLANMSTLPPVSFLTHKLCQVRVALRQRDGR